METQTASAEHPSGRKATIEEILILEELNKSKKTGLRNSSMKMPSMLDEIPPKTAHKDKEVVNGGKRSKTPHEVKPVKKHKHESSIVFKR